VAAAAAKLREEEDEGDKEGTGGGWIRWGQGQGRSFCTRLWPRSTVERTRGMPGQRNNWHRYSVNQRVAYRYNGKKLNTPKSLII
jgi:hypothetical protein